MIFSKILVFFLGKLLRFRFQMFHGDINMSRPEFWEMYDSSLYDYVRSKYACCQGLPDLYEKVYRNAYM